jgi:hypothetical protein
MPLSSGFSIQRNELIRVPHRIHTEHHISPGINEIPLKTVIDFTDKSWEWDIRVRGVKRTLKRVLGNNYANSTNSSGITTTDEEKNVWESTVEFYTEGDLSVKHEVVEFDQNIGIYGGLRFHKDHVPIASDPISISFREHTWSWVGSGGLLHQLATDLCVHPYDVPELRMVQSPDYVPGSSATPATYAHTTVTFIAASGIVDGEKVSIILDVNTTIEVTGSSTTNATLLANLFVGMNTSTVNWDITSPSAGVVKFSKNSSYTTNAGITGQTAIGLVSADIVIDNSSNSAAASTVSMNVSNSVDGNLASSGGDSFVVLLNENGYLDDVPADSTQSTQRQVKSTPGTEDLLRTPDGDITGGLTTSGGGILDVPSDLATIVFGDAFGYLASTAPVNVVVSSIDATTDAVLAVSVSQETDGSNVIVVTDITNPGALLDLSSLTYDYSNFPAHDTNFTVGDVIPITSGLWRIVRSDTYTFNASITNPAAEGQSTPITIEAGGLLFPEANRDIAPSARKIHTGNIGNANDIIYMPYLKSDLGNGQFVISVDGRVLPDEYWYSKSISAVGDSTTAKRYSTFHFSGELEKHAEWVIDPLNCVVSITFEWDYSTLKPYGALVGPNGFSPIQEHYDDDHSFISKNGDIWSYDAPSLDAAGQVVRGVLTISDTTQFGIYDVVMLEYAKSAGDGFEPAFRLVYPTTNNLDRASVESSCDDISTLFVVESTPAVDILSRDSQYGLTQHMPGNSATQEWRIRFEWLEESNDLKVCVATKYQIKDDGTITQGQDRTGIQQKVFRLPGELCDVYHEPVISRGVTATSVKNKSHWFRRTDTKMLYDVAPTYPISYKLTTTNHGVALFVWEHASVGSDTDSSWFVIQRQVDQTTGQPDVTGKCPLHCVYSPTKRGRTFEGLEQYYASSDIADLTPSPIIYDALGNALRNPSKTYWVSNDSVFDGYVNAIDFFGKGYGAMATDPDQRKLLSRFPSVDDLSQGIVAGAFTHGYRSYWYDFYADSNDYVTSLNIQGFGDLPRNINTSNWQIDFAENPLSGSPVPVTMYNNIIQVTVSGGEITNIVISTDESAIDNELFTLSDIGSSFLLDIDNVTNGIPHDDVGFKPADLGPVRFIVDGESSTPSTYMLDTSYFADMITNGFGGSGYIDSGANPYVIGLIDVSSIGASAVQTPDFHPGVLDFSTISYSGNLIFTTLTPYRMSPYGDVSSVHGQCIDRTGTIVQLPQGPNKNNAEGCLAVGRLSTSWTGIQDDHLWVPPAIPPAEQGTNLDDWKSHADTLVDLLAPHNMNQKVKILDSMIVSLNEITVIRDLSAYVLSYDEWTKDGDPSTVGRFLESMDINNVNRFGIKFRLPMFSTTDTPVYDFTSATIDDLNPTEVWPAGKEMFNADGEFILKWGDVVGNLTHPGCCNLQGLAFVWSEDSAGAKYIINRCRHGNSGYINLNPYQLTVAPGSTEPSDETLSQPFVTDKSQTFIQSTLNPVLKGKLPGDVIFTDTSSNNMYYYDFENKTLYFKKPPATGSELAISFDTTSGMDNYIVEVPQDKDFTTMIEDSYISINRFVVREADVLKPWDYHLSATKHHVDSYAIINPYEQLSVTDDREFVFSFPTQLTSQRFYYPTSELDMICISSAGFSTQGGHIEIDKYNDSTGITDAVYDAGVDGTFNPTGLNDVPYIYSGQIDQGGTQFYWKRNKRKYEGMTSTLPNGNGMRVFVLVTGSSVRHSDVPKGTIST